jgi:acetylornithine deacetylase/succinyl-diaminopimelate desuccinylase-like protein
MNLKLQTSTHCRSTILAFTALAAYSMLNMAHAALTPLQQQAKEIYKQLVEIDTTHSTGDTTVAAQAMADRLIAAGLPREDVKVIGDALHKGNLVARWRAKSPKRKPILLLAHLDVVEAKREDWTTDPMKFVETDGYYYARGIVDDKAMASIFVANVVRYLQEGYRPNRDIIIALTADEESGTNNGAEWLVDNHRDLVDAAFALNEGGGGQMHQGKKILNGVQAAEKLYVTFKLEATNRGGHSSQPRSDNAINDISRALLSIAQYQFPVQFSDVTRGYFSAMAKLESGQNAADFSAILQPTPDSQALARFSTQPMVNSLLRTTCVATMIEGGHAENALPQSARATVNCRLLPGDKPEAIEATLAKIIANDHITLTMSKAGRPTEASPLNAEVMKPIEQVTQKMWPGVPVVPVMSTGATDAVPFRNAGIPVYGVSGLFGDIDDVRIHGRDERIAIDAYYDGLEFLYQLVKALSH